MVYGTQITSYNELVTGANLNQLITGGQLCKIGDFNHHLVVTYGRSDGHDIYIYIYTLYICIFNQTTNDISVRSDRWIMSVA